MHSRGAPPIRLPLVALVAFILLASVRSASASRDLSVLDNSFSPAGIKIKAGETVVWRNNGSNLHTVTADDSSFDSSPSGGGMTSGSSFSHTFYKEGSFGYHCKIHAEMNGVVEVVDPPDTYITSGPEPTTVSSSAAFAFVSSESGSTFECAIDSFVFNPCNSPKSFSGLAHGGHFFLVSAIDMAGNQDVTPDRWDWTIAGPSGSEPAPSPAPAGSLPSADVSPGAPRAASRSTATGRKGPSPTPASPEESIEVAPAPKEAEEDLGGVPIAPSLPRRSNLQAAAPPLAAPGYPWGAVGIAGAGSGGLLAFVVARWRRRERPAKQAAIEDSECLGLKLKIRVISVRTDAQMVVFGGAETWSLPWISIRAEAELEALGDPGLLEATLSLRGESIVSSSDGYRQSLPIDFVGGDSRRIWVSLDPPTGVTTLPFEARVRFSDRLWHEISVSGSLSLACVLQARADGDGHSDQAELSVPLELEMDFTTGKARIEPRVSSAK